MRKILCFLGIHPFGQKVLKHHFPNSISYNDITKTDFSIHKGKIDILTGGFPCQPYSSAGKRLGKSDERHLFPEMLRAIKEIKPRWIIGENVRGLLSWNEGMVFHEVYTDLEREGYEVQSFLIPAASVNAPHHRARVWFVAHSPSIGLCKYSEGKRLQSKASRTQFRMDKEKTNGYDKWKNFPTQPFICGGDDGIPKELDNITFPKWRKESIKAKFQDEVGNFIAEAINEKVERLNPLPDPNLIDSMAMRYRHDFGLLSKEQQDTIRTTMKQIWEEVVGLGFYKKEKTK